MKSIIEIKNQHAKEIHDRYYKDVEDIYQKQTKYSHELLLRSFINHGVRSDT